MKNKVSCSLPFTQIYNSPGRNYSPCCWAKYKTESNPYNTLPLDYFNNEDLSRLRKEMMSGEMTDFIDSICGNCFDQERENGSSIRKDLHNEVSEEVLKNFDDSGHVLPQNRFLTMQVSFSGNSCNLECYECFPISSSSRKKSIKKLGTDWEDLLTGNAPTNLDLLEDIKKKNKIQFNSIINHIADNASSIKVIQVLGGEPFLMKSHFDLLDRLIEIDQAKNICLSYVSNMTVMELKYMKKYFDSFPFTFLQWSVDALNERNHWLRYPTNWENTLKNVFDIKDYFNKTRRGKISSTITPSLLSISTFKETYDFLYMNKLLSKEDQFFNNVTDPKMLRTRNLPDELKNQISSSVKSLSEFHYNQLMHERSEEEFQLAVKYFDALDQSRGTDWRSTFPEVAKYAN